MSVYTVYHRVIKLSLHPGFLKNIKIQQEYCGKKEAKKLICIPQDPWKYKAVSRMRGRLFCFPQRIQ